MATFDYLRISLSRPSLPELLARAGVEEAPRDRTEWIREAFSTRRDFLYRKRLFCFVPKGDVDGFATGFFGRHNSALGRAGPDEEFHEIRLDSWDLSFVAVNLRPDSQIALIQYNQNVGSTRGILEAFLEDVARGKDYREWAPHAEHLFSETSYWEVAEKYRGQITRLKFTFVPPNALRAEERVMDFIRDAAEHASAQSVTHQYDDPDGGLDPKGELIEGSVNVASRGGGTAEIKVGKRTVFSDQDHRETESVPHEEIPDPERPTTILGFVKNFFKR